jgi:hypothetical protein
MLKNLSIFFKKYVLYIYIYIYIVGRPEGRRPLGRPRRRWEDNIKMDLTEIRFGVCLVMHSNRTWI